MAKSRNTFQKTQRELEKKRKAEQKRQDKLRKKDLDASLSTERPLGENDSDESPRGDDL